MKDESDFRVDLENRVAAHPFLYGLSAHHVRLLADCALATHFHAGETIFCVGETANRFYLIESGSVAIEGRTKNGTPITIDTISGGDLLGWSWLFKPYGWDLMRAHSQTRRRSSFTEQYCATTVTGTKRSATSFSGE